MAAALAAATALLLSLRQLRSILVPLERLLAARRGGRIAVVVEDLRTPYREALGALVDVAALRAAGLMPRLDACARCGAAAPGALARFDPAHGGVLCERCRPEGSAAAREARPETIAGLRALQAGGGGEPGDPAAAAEARDLLTAYIEYQLGRRLAARRFLDEVGPQLGR